MASKQENPDPNQPQPGNEPQPGEPTEEMPPPGEDDEQDPQPAEQYQGRQQF
jgi:hypothetical protein